MTTKKTVTDLIEVCKEVATWIHKNAPSDDSRTLLNRFWAEIHAAENELSKKRAGYLLLIENAKRGRRITITVEEPGRYLSRVGWESAGIEAQITHHRQVRDMEAARDELKSLCPNEKFTAMGMEWTQSPASSLKTVMDSMLTK